MGQKNAVLAFEPEHFGNERLVLFGDGRVQKVNSSELHRLLDARDMP